jgi:hypothetical protein
MNCAACEDRGVIRFRYHDGSPDEFGVCLCRAASGLRSNANAGKRTGIYGWHVWAAREQIDPARVFLVEELLDDDEMVRTFPDLLDEETVTTSAEDIAAAMRTHRTKL